MKKLAAVAAIFWVSITYGQQPCGTTQAVEKSLKQNLDLKRTLENLEKFTASYTPLATPKKRIIPVVVHIIHQYGSENISKSQVLDAIRILNEDFNLKNPDTAQVVEFFKPRMGNTGFEFRLARRDPRGNCTDGITRTIDPLSFNADDQVKDLISWDTRNYLNIWVVGRIGWAGGYAYYPGTAPRPEYEGIVINHNLFGNTGTSTVNNNGGRITTHEAGHYFNLMHTWGDNNDCGTGSCSGQGDMVDDTPITLGNCNTCNPGAARCSGILENVENYMDYSRCIRMFTAGQSLRMQAATDFSAGGRDNLWTEANLMATGVSDNYQADPCIPMADLPLNPFIICQDDSIQFTDISYGADIDGTYVWAWEFPGGNPSVSNLPNPKVRYANAGSYDVKLKVSNKSGSSSTERKNLIRVYPRSSNVSAPWMEDFDGVFPGSSGEFWKNWQTNLGGEIRNWTPTSRAALSPQTALAVLNPQSILAVNTTYKIRTPALNLKSAVNHKLSFDWAYSFRADTRDRLRINVSKDCEESFYTISQAGLSQLNTTPNRELFDFIPKNDDWRRMTVDIASLANESAVVFEFEFINLAEQTGNLYLDNVNIGGFNTGFTHAYRAQMSLFPNPVRMAERIIISGIEIHTIISIFDINGRQLNNVVYDGNALSAADAGISAPGVYLVKAEHYQVLSKLVVIP